MEPRFQLTVAGQSPYQSDINLIADEAALADDRTLAELLRLSPYGLGGGSTVSKAVIPYRVQGTGGTVNSTGQVIVSPAGVGGVTVYPFRAVVGTVRDSASIGGKDNWRDIRSAVFAGNTTLSSLVALSNTDYPRWDLVYAAVTLSATIDSAIRKAKSETTGAVSSQSVVIRSGTTVTVGVVQGANDGNRPAIPSDGAGVYYIPLAYLRVPANFSASSTLDATRIYEVSPCVGISSALGCPNVRPADGSYKTDGAVVTANPWGLANATPPPGYLPPTQCGAEELFFSVDLIGLSGADISHPSGAVIDASRDWTKRAFLSTVQGKPASESPQFPWMGHATHLCPQSNGSAPTVQMGQSFVGDYSAGAGAVIMTLNESNCAAIANNATIVLWVDRTTGQLKLSYSGGEPNCLLFFWIRATAQNGNSR